MLSSGVRFFDFASVPSPYGISRGKSWSLCQSYQQQLLPGHQRRLDPVALPQGFLAFAQGGGGSEKTLERDTPPTLMKRRQENKSGECAVRNGYGFAILRTHHSGPSLGLPEVQETGGPLLLGLALRPQGGSPPGF